MKPMRELGWHCDCLPGLYGIGVWNGAGVESCWNCGAGKPLRGLCPVQCGCREETLGIYKPI